MPAPAPTDDTPANPMAAWLDAQAQLAKMVMGQTMPETQPDLPDMGEMAQWAQNAGKLQALWLEFQRDAMREAGETLETRAGQPMPDPSGWVAMVEGWYKQMPFASLETQQQLWRESTALWEAVIGQYAGGTSDAPDLPRNDKRFADERWRSQPVFALIHQTYLMLSEQVERAVDRLQGLTPEKREQLRFATRAMIDTLSPANFPATNPVVLERTLETQGANLVAGMEHLLADLKRGQLTHTDPEAFRLGENIAVTPGKVVLETPLFQLIQYSPTTDKVLETPLVIFPPWINRFYILDLNPKKSFVRWAVEQGVSVFMVSWKSADASMKDVVWDDYIAAQEQAIDFIRERLDVPSVHAIGYCVSGTTLAATLAIMARRGEAEKVKSATFFTAQVDFEHAGDLLNFVDEAQLSMLEQVSSEGYLDGRVMAATFNMLRGTDLIWNYVINNYLLGEDYPAFDLLHWNGDVTNLPAKWHQSYLRELYRDNKLVQPDAMEANGIRIDLRLVETPTYVQAGIEDHIAPPQSVWKLVDHFSGPTRFVLAGSGHIAGVVNPPEAGKYQYWRNDEPVGSLEEFRAGAVEHPGSWWPDWIEWLRAQAPEEVKATGKRSPGGKGDKVLEDAPGRYVTMR